MLKINRIQAENFKAFSSLDINLEGKNTVIFGINGTGKSTILSLINYCFWSWINRLNPAQSTTYRSLSSEMINAKNSKLSICTCVDMDNMTFELRRGFVKNGIGRKNSSVIQRVTYDEFIRCFSENYLKEDSDMPIFVNYGTNRSVLDIPLRIRQRHDFSKLASLDRAIEKELDFRTFFEWYRNQEDYENEVIRETGQQDYQDKCLRSVRFAIQAMLGDNVSDLKVKRAPLRMTVVKDNIEVRVDQLSDGEKCTLALLGDLARRISLANPNKEDPLNGDGIVLIDEIELHMHPSWQRRIVSVLKSTFPNIQFIITTHSPQVLSELDNGFNIFKLNNGNEDLNYVKYDRLDGYDSSIILEDYMDSSSKNQKYLNVFNSAIKAIEDNQFDEAEKIIGDVAEFSSVNSPDVIKLEGILRRKVIRHDMDQKGR